MIKMEPRKGENREELESIIKKFPCRKEQQQQQNMVAVIEHGYRSNKKHCID